MSLDLTFGLMAGPKVLHLVPFEDTHLYHWQLYVPSGDVLVHAGDCLAESLAHFWDGKKL